MHPWERQAGETAKQYSYFCVYRDLGPQRSIDRAWRSYSADVGQPSGGRAPRSWFTWSAQRSWVDRAEQWDADQERSLREEREEKRRALATIRENFEIEQQRELQLHAVRLREKLQKALTMPNTNVKDVKYSEDGERVVQEREVQGIRLGEIAA